MLAFYVKKEWWAKLLFSHVNYTDSGWNSDFTESSLWIPHFRNVYIPESTEQLHLAVTQTPPPNAGSQNKTRKQNQVLRFYSDQHECSSHEKHFSPFLALIINTAEDRTRDLVVKLQASTHHALLGHSTSKTRPCKPMVRARALSSRMQTEVQS